MRIIFDSPKNRDRMVESLLDAGLCPYDLGLSQKGSDCEVPDRVTGNWSYKDCYEACSKCWKSEMERCSSIDTMWE